MSLYTTLDNAIVTRLRDTPHLKTTFVSLQHAPAIKAELEKAIAGTRRETFRVLDARLQALRKKGTLSYSSANGWRLAAAAVPA